MTRELIVVVGATGTIGREVVAQLMDAGQRVRAMVRDSSKAGRFDRPVEIVQADLARPETLAAVFAGAEKAFIVTNGLGLVLESHAFAAAKATGTKHIVRVSALEIEFPELASAPLGQWHLESERRLRESGISWTLLRPSYFASNTLLPFIVDRQGGSVFLPTGNGEEAPIDPRDIAAVAVKALTEPGHENEVYLLTGPQLLSFGEMMEEVSAAAGKPLRHVDMAEGEARKRLLTFGIPAPFADSLLAHCAAVRSGRSYRTSTVAHLLGRPARTFRDWIRDHADLIRG